MRIFLVAIVLMVLGGCSAETVQKVDVAKGEEAKDSKVVRSNEKLEDLLKEVKVEKQLTEACEDMSIEMTTAYLDSEDERPSIIGFCHNTEDISSVNQPAYLAAAVYDESTDRWNIDVLENEHYSNPARFAGILTLKDGSERVVIELYEQQADFGKMGAIIVSLSDTSLETEYIRSEWTQNGQFKTKDNHIIIEDDFTTETLTYNKNDVTHTKVLKDIDTHANQVIFYNKFKDEPLFATPESGSVLDLHPGDIISFKPKKPLSLASFQIRTDMKSYKDKPSTYMVSGSDIGGTVELGEYPYEDMVVYHIGEPSVFATNTYFESLKKGIMPDSKIQLTTPNSKISTILKDEQLLQEVGDAGANLLVYEKFIYAVPFLKEEGDIIYAVMRKLPVSSKLTGDSFIESWGKPDEQFTDSETQPQALTLQYDFPEGHYVRVNLNGETSKAKAVTIALHRKNR